MTDTDSLRAQYAAAMRATPATGHTHKPGQEKWDHHPAPGERGHRFLHDCALCCADTDALVGAVLAVRDRETEQLRADLAAGDEELARLSLHNDRTCEAVAERDRLEAEAARLRTELAATRPAEKTHVISEWIIQSRVDSEDTWDMVGTPYPHAEQVEARARLAQKRERLPEYEHRLACRTVTTALRPVAEVEAS